LIVWKKLAFGRLCKLRIPSKAKRTASVVGRKCRTEFAEVLSITDSKGKSCYTGEGHYDGGETLYIVGETVRPDKYDDNPLVECTHGIHFFLTKQEAEEYI
jgi:hypothetical protein